MEREKSKSFRKEVPSLKKTNQNGRFPIRGGGGADAVYHISKRVFVHDARKAMRELSFSAGIS